MQRSVSVSTRAHTLLGLAGAFVGSIVFAVLHCQWYSHWMRLFGDPPAANPAYYALSPLFFAAPYVASGCIAGLIAGSGGLRPGRLALARFVCGPMTLCAAVLALVGPEAQFHTWLVPVAMVAFLLSAGITSLPGLHAPG